MSLFSYLLCGMAIQGQLYNCVEPNIMWMKAAVQGIIFCSRGTNTTKPRARTSSHQWELYFKLWFGGTKHMILLLLFDAGVTSEEVIPDHEYWISFMVQYQKEKEYVEKNTHLPYNLYPQSWRKGFIFSLLILFFILLDRREFQWLISQQVQGGLRMGWRMMVPREGGAGQIWVNPAFTELTAYYSLTQYRALTWYNVDSSQIE